MDGVMLEFTKILDKCRKELVEGYISATTDFWTDSHRREQFGALVADVTAEKYEFEDGRNLFMSRQTKNGLGADVLKTVCAYTFILYLIFLSLHITFLFVHSLSTYQHHLIGKAYH